MEETPPTAAPRLIYRLEKSLWGPRAPQKQAGQQDSRRRETITA